MGCKLNFLNQYITSKPEVFLDCHDYDEFVYYLDGSGTTKIGDTVYEYGPDTFTYIKAGTWHDERHFTPSHILFVTFWYDDPEDLSESGFFSDAEICHTLLNLLKQAKYEFSHQDYRFEAMIQNVLQQAVISVTRERLMLPSQPKVLTFIKNFLDDNYHQPLRVDSLARLCNYSYDYFRHMFKQEFGRSIQSYIMEKRLTRAKELLRSTDHSVLDISMECGFSNAGQFSTMFKKSFGVTPLKYRKNIGMHVG